MEPMPMQYDQQPPPVYMEQPKSNPLQNVQGILANLNIRPIKEPRGFMKILQFIFGICAFATTTSYSTTIKFLRQCQNGNSNITVSEEITYPFNIDSTRTKYPDCSGAQQTLYMGGNFSSDAQFFVAVGVLSFLYSIAALVLYCLFTALYDNKENVPIADFGIHFILSILWLAASSAWANSTSSLSSATDVKFIISENGALCNTASSCIPIKEAGYAGLAISILFGFLNMFLWGSNLWFLYKETRYFKDKAGVTDGTQQLPPN